MGTTITHQIIKKNTFSLSPISRINLIIEKEKINSIGISIALIMLGTGIASITAAMAVSTSSFFILIGITILAMGSNVVALSQRSFKTIVWAFIVNIGLNIGLIIYQISLL
ncbi:MAG: hypothetical protein JKY02_10955 [Flavobacteriaceae bacterium]|nr:hypothetical protein [Flavobacteriaceae bacterium]